jgi:ATP-binding cassette subfamily B protein
VSSDRGSTSAPPALSVWSHLRRYRLRVAAGVFMLFVTTALAATVPWLLGRVVDALGGPTPAETVPPLALAMGLCALAQAGTRIASRLALFNAARRAEYDLRSQLFRHLLHLDPAYYRAHSTGDVMSRLTSDVQTVRALWGPGILNIVNTTVQFTVMITLMLRIDPWLTLWAMVPLPAMVLLGRLFGRRIYRASADVQAQLGLLSSGLQEDLTGIGIIKAYTLEEHRMRQFERRSSRLLERNMELTRSRGQMIPALAALASTGSVIVLWVGGTEVVDGRMALGQMVQFQGYLAQLVWPTLALGWVMAMFQRGMASFERLRELLATRPRIVDAPGAEPGPPVHGALSIRHLSIETGGRRLLSDVSLEVPAGTTLALVGRTGAGKTTLIEAIARLTDVPRGTIFLDGRDICDLPVVVLRSAIGYAPQDAFLFSTTIAGNVAFGVDRVRPDADVDERADRIARATTAAGLDRDLAALPAGLDTIVGERGITLSGGQRQRVALARALATEPRLLLLDDSLSSVDAETEREILGQLDTVLAGRTCILISHRVAALRRAHRIVVLDEGRVAEQGSHDELLAAGGIYAELYRDQLIGATAPAAAAATPMDKVPT